MLTSRLGSFEGLAVADLFAGSGALGLEALSRGAASCLFVENERPALDALAGNIAKLQAATCATVLPQSVLTLGQARATFDLVMMDPPYTTGAGAVALDKLSRLGWIAPSTWVAIETGAKETIEVAGFTVETVRNTGKARLHLLQQA